MSQGKVRCPNVDEWFLSLQLEQVKKGLHIPLYLHADVTEIVKKYPERTPYTAILIKAASHVLQKVPEVNNAVFHTFLGMKMVEPAYNAVNLPLELFIEGKRVLTGISIKDAYKKTLEEINSEIKTAKKQTLKDLPLNSIIHSPGVSWLKKLKLKLLFTLMNNFPKLYLKKGGGGISVSSIMNQADPLANVHMNAFGMTNLTISCCHVADENGRKIMKLGAAFDHIMVHGSLGAKSTIELVKILQNPELF